MKKLYILLIIFQIPLHLVHATEVKTISITYDYSDFIMAYNNSGALVIDSHKHSISYKEKSDEPGIPFIPLNVLIPNNSSYNSMNVSVDPKLVMEDVVLASNPISTSTFNHEDVQSLAKTYNYSNRRFPSSCVEYVGTSIADGYTILNFLISPFEYDVPNKKLYFHEAITFDILLNETPEKGTLLTAGGKNMRDIVKHLVINGEEIDEIQPKRSNVSYNDPIDYVIITSSALASSFQPIARWKKMKGIRSRIITIDDIASNYTGSTIQLKIKECLYDLYQNNGLKYALLGGDNTVIPVQGCYGEVVSDKGLVTNNSIPTDLFYACFDNCFNWDGNGNSIYGDTLDNIDMSPEIVVTRVPVRSVLDVESFSSKLLSYEKTPTMHGWNDNILMAGKKIKVDYSSTQSDAEYKGDKLYSDYIMPYWSGTRKKFYDTNTDFLGGANYALNSSNLQTQLSNGYTFMDMITHGTEMSWDLESGLYYSSHAQSLVNDKFTIITTTACSTNAFDSTLDPCFSEAFIRNANNGVIAYLGCSRESWYWPESMNLGPSLQFESFFYNSLFSESWCQTKNFGTIVNEARFSMFSSQPMYTYNAYRWLQFGVNPLGDPEMPIYTSTPEEFTDCIITYENGTLSIDTGVERCSICVMSLEDDGASYYEVFKNTQDVCMSGIPSKISICITKQNYIPKIINLSNIYIQNEIVTGPIIYEANNIAAGSSVTSSMPCGPVIFNGGTIQLKANTVTLEPETTININTNLIISNH